MKKICMLTVIFIFMGVSLGFAGDKTILIIESYHSEYPWDISYKRGIEKIINKRYRLEYFQMDTKRLPKDRFEVQAQLAWEFYKKTDPDLVMLGDDNALRYLGPRLGKTQTPVVYLGINNNPRAYGINKFENITGVLERPLAKRSIIYLSELIKPKLGKILILFDSGITSRVSVREMFSDQASVLVAGVQIDLKLIGSLSEWKKSVLSARLKGYGAIVVGLYQTIVDEYGNHVKAADIINWTYNNTTVPPFGFWDFTVGAEKTVGGLVLFGQTQGEAAARIALQILAGKHPKEIPPITGKKGRFYFSRSHLKKWDLVLPENIASKADFAD